MNGTKSQAKRLHKQENAQFEGNILEDSKVKESLSSLKSIVQSSYGPTGRLKFLQTESGGHVTVTSTSSRIFNQLTSVSSPVTQLILTAVKGHLNACSDGGLYTTSLILSLVESFLKLETRPIIRVNICEYIHSLIQKFFSSDSCPAKFKLDTGNVKQMLAVVKGVIGTKPAAKLTSQDLDQISILVLKAFFQSLPTGSHSSPSSVQHRVRFHTCEGSSVSTSHSIPGIILEAPHIPTYANHHSLPNTSPAKVALFNVSLAGDTEEWLEGLSVEMLSEDGTSHKEMSEGVVKVMLEAGDKLVQRGVKVVLCQKCIHPAMIRHLEAKGVYCIERLSIIHMKAVQLLTGATVLGTFSTDVTDENFGHLGQVQHEVINRKSYLHLYPMTSETSPVTTIILCSPDEAALDELKVASSAALDVLSFVWHDPYATAGGGCVATQIATFLRQHATQTTHEEATIVGSNKVQLMEGFSSVALCFEAVARSLEKSADHMIDSTHHHHWIVPPGTDPSHVLDESCACGMVTRNSQTVFSIMGFTTPDLVLSFVNTQHSIVRNNAVLDAWPVKRNALRVAFETACVVLRIRSFIKDLN